MNRQGRKGPKGPKILAFIHGFAVPGVAFVLFVLVCPFVRGFHDSPHEQYPDGFTTALARVPTRTRPGLVGPAQRSRTARTARTTAKYRLAGPRPAVRRARTH